MVLSTTGVEVSLGQSQSQSQTLDQLARRFRNRHHHHHHLHHLHHHPPPPPPPSHHNHHHNDRRTNNCRIAGLQRRNSRAITQANNGRRGSCAQSGSNRCGALVLVCWHLTIALLMAVSCSQAYPSGAPEQACKDLKPGHGVEPQTGAAPFELGQDKLQVNAGEQIKVTLSSPSGTNFKGLIVQANNEAGEPKGKFLAGTGLKTLDSCSAVTHSDREAKKTATLVWQAPDDLKSKEAFVFKATVVKKFDEIYTNIKSSLKTS